MDSPCVCQAVWPLSVGQTDVFGERHYTDGVVDAGRLVFGVLESVQLLEPLLKCGVVFLASNGNVGNLLCGIADNVCAAERVDRP